MRRICVTLAMCLIFAATIGCGKPALHPVGGVVKIDGKPASGVRVFLWSTSLSSSTPDSRFGMGFTDENGRFTINCGTGEEGMERGSYRVTFSRYLMNGKPMTKKDRPSNAVESVPAPYNDMDNPANSPVLISVPTSEELVLEIPRKK